MQRKALPFKSPWDKVPHHRSCLTCHSSLPLHSLVKLACLKPSVCSSLPLTSVHHLLPSFLHSYFWSPISACVAQILGNFSNPPSWKLPFPPLNHPLTGPLVLGLGKYHSTSSLLYISREHPRAGLSLSQPSPSCPAKETLACPRSLEDIRKFYKLENAGKQNHPKLLFVIWQYMQNLWMLRLYK